MQSKMILAALAFTMILAGPLQAVPLTSQTPSLKRDLTDLVRFAQHNLNLDPRVSTLTPAERLQALVESLQLYGVRFPDRQRLRPGMTANQVADVLMRTLSMDDRRSLATLASAFLVGLRASAAPSRYSARSQPIAFGG